MGIQISKLIINIVICIGLLGSARLADAQPNLLSGPPPPPPPCFGRAGIEIELSIVGQPLVGFAVQVSANGTKIVLTDRRCDQTLEPLTSFHWDLLSRPQQSGTQLQESATPAPHLRLDAPGEYRIRFTGCPSGCMIGNDRVEPRSGEITIQALQQTVIPPESVPLLPPSANGIAGQPSSDGLHKCRGGFDLGSFLANPEWVTVNPFQGAGSFETLEGWVDDSRVSADDNTIQNHVSHDADFVVTPDTRFDNLFTFPAVLQQRSIEVEWERNEIHEPFWPSAGDRISTFGYWVHDCGHSPFDTEIHPPVGVVVHRARPVVIPSDRQFPFFRAVCAEPPCPPAFSTMGSNVVVPGIITDIWFSRYGGAITGGCHASTLHGPGDSGGCVTDPSPLNRIFEFNIYLPRAPHITYKQGGRLVPPVPLYFEVMPGNGPTPVVEQRREGDVFFLNVRLDLTDLASDTYERRIVAAWVFPSPDNWGLRSWRLSVSSIIVYSTGDLVGGDWRLWINTNNGSHEWTRLIDCDSCVNIGLLSYANLGGRAPWETGPTGVLGPDILLFAGQPIRVHSSAYDQDVFHSDDRGVINDSLPQDPATRQTTEFRII